MGSSRFAAGDRVYSRINGLRGEVLEAPTAAGTVLVAWDGPRRRAGPVKSRVVAGVLAHVRGSLRMATSEEIGGDDGWG